VVRQLESEPSGSFARTKVCAGELLTRRPRRGRTTFRASASLGADKCLQKRYLQLEEIAQNSKIPTANLDCRAEWSSKTLLDRITQLEATTLVGLG
jgi:hypothetical protein